MYFLKGIINCTNYKNIQVSISMNERIIFWKMETYHFTIARFYSVKYMKIIISIIIYTMFKT